jgi:hypothetical protein
MNGLGMRHLCDWMLFLHSRGECIDKENLKNTLEALDML